MKCGIVGLPNIGKSTLFNALTRGGAAAENYPFSTIDPNIGAASLADARLAQVAAAAQAAKTINAAAEFADIAGLIKGASQNAGLGNRFLAHIREADGIAHVVRCFEDGDITHVDGRVSPADDAAVVNLELVLADIATVEKAAARAKKTRDDEDAPHLLAAAEKLLAVLNGGGAARDAALNEKELAAAKTLCLLTMKPMLYVANVDDAGGGENDGDNALLAALKKFAKDTPVLPVCARLEAELAELPPEEQAEFLRAAGFEDSGLNRLARAAFEMLGLQTYFTAGPEEARAWTIKKGATAPEAAAVIHNDISHGFVCAEVANWRDFVECGGEAGARAAGKWRREGRDYCVADGDVVHFKFSPPRPKKGTMPP